MAPSIHNRAVNPPGWFPLAVWPPWTRMEPPGHKEKAKAGEHLVGEGVQQEALAAGLLGVHEPRVEGPHAAGVAGVELRRHSGALRGHQQAPGGHAREPVPGEHKQGRRRGHATAAHGSAPLAAHGLHPARSARGMGGS